MTNAQIDAFWKQAATQEELSLHGDLIIQWLDEHPRKDDRPACKEDIMDDMEVPEG